MRRILARRRGAAAGLVLASQAATTARDGCTGVVVMHFVPGPPLCTRRRSIFPRPLPPRFAAKNCIIETVNSVTAPLGCAAAWAPAAGALRGRRPRPAPVFAHVALPAWRPPRFACPAPTGPAAHPPQNFLWLLQGASPARLRPPTCAPGRPAAAALRPPAAASSARGRPLLALLFAGAARGAAVCLLRARPWSGRDGPAGALWFPQARRSWGPSRLNEYKRMLLAPFLSRAIDSKRSTFVTLQMAVNQPRLRLPSPACASRSERHVCCTGSSAGHSVAVTLGDMGHDRICHHPHQATLRKLH